MSDRPARRATIAVKWQSVDITKQIEPDLLLMTFGDNLTGAVDDLTLTLQDRTGKWVGDWRPQYGDTVMATLDAEPWLTNVKSLQLGPFAHDKISAKGFPKTISLKCVSAPLATGLRRRKRTKAWSGLTLKGIAQDVADAAKLTLKWDGAEGYRYKRRDQVNQSNLEFLEELCKEVGRNLKVTRDSIAVFDELTRDSAASVGTIDLDGGFVKDFNFDGDDSDHYGSCHISFFDPRSGKMQKAEFNDPNNPDGQTLELRLPMESLGEGKAKAQALLRNANRFATRGHLVTVGDPGLVAGLTFDLKGLAGLDGKFIITKAGHQPVGGYTCALDVRRCVEGY